MERTKLTRVLALVLTFSMLFGATMSVFAAEDLFTTTATTVSTGLTETSEAAPSDSFAEALEQLNDITWPEYAALYADVKPYGGEPIVIPAAGYESFSYPAGMTEEETALPLKLFPEYDGKKNALQIPDIGTVTWKVTVPESGLYQIGWDYFPVQNKATNIERTLRVNGTVPFGEVRNLLMTKIWHDVYQYDENGNIVFEKDGNLNDSRPDKEETPEWRSYTVSDPTGYYNGNFYFYLEAGENTISLTSQREPVILSEIRLTKVENTITYEEYLAANKGKADNAASVSPIKWEAEHPSSTSDKTICPDNNRASSVNSPQHASYILCNVIGGSNWATTGQWIEWTVDVPEDGFYQIYARFLQSAVEGLYVTRRLRIDGEIPFYEANNVSFIYNNSWQIGALGNDTEDFSFYLTKGTHKISMEVTFGDLGSILSRVNVALNEINAIYLKILSITGPNPDAYQDYKFYTRIPDSIAEMRTLSKELYDIADEMEAITGGASSNQATLEKVAQLLQKMASNSETQIAKNFSALKTNIGSLGTWLNTMQSQALMLDYMVLQPAGTKLDTKTYKAVGNFFENFGFEISAFLWSFIRDNSALSATVVTGDGVNLDVWTTVSRERASIIRELVNGNFSTAHPDVAVNIKVVAAGTLLPATFSGTGPDIMMDVGQSDAINYAVRGAVVDLSDCENFQKLSGRFQPSSWTALTVALDSEDGEKAVFGVPQEQSFSVMFYRKDILAKLGIETAPTTWKEFEKVTELLIAQGYDIGLGTTSSATDIQNIFITMLYQKGGALYQNGGTEISFAQDIALDAFTEVCEFYTLKKLPVKYDAANRFRTGEMPILVADYITFYNQFTIYATELKGMWGFTTLPGTMRADGTIDNSVISTITCMVVMRDAEKKKDVAFDYMEWWTRDTIQSQYANELVAVLGPAGKYNTANYQSFTEMPWSASEAKLLKKQFENLVGMPEMPGGYIISRYVNFAFLEAYNNGKSPSDELQGYVDTINREMERKREELTRAFFIPTDYNLFG